MTITEQQKNEIISEYLAEQEGINIEELTARLKADLMAKRKKSESIWRKSRATLTSKIPRAFPETYRKDRIIDYIGRIGAIISGHRTTASFNDNDTEWLEQMFDDIINIAVKYKRI